MRRFGITCIIFIVLVITSCCSSSDPQNNENKTEIEEESIPVGAIPIHYQRHIVIIGTYNDSVKAKWVFDTGCPYPVLDSSFFVESGYQFLDSPLAYAFGAGNGRTTTYLVKQDHCMQADTFNNVPEKIHVLDLRKAVGDKTADGILHVKYFGDKILEISYQQEYLLIHPDSFQPDTNWASIPFQYSKNRILVDALVEVEKDKTVQGPFILDLGSGGSFTLNTKASNEINIFNTSKDVEIMDLANGGIGGKTTIGLLRADRCGIGPFTLEDVPVSYSTNKRGAFSDKNSYGIIGNYFLERFDMIIDFVNDRLLLKPNPDFNKKFKKRKASGLSLIDRTISEGGFKINGLVRKSPADTVGFKLDDLIVAVEGQKVKKTQDAKETQRLIDSLAIVDDVELIFRRNNVLDTLVLKTAN